MPAYSQEHVCAFLVDFQELGGKISPLPHRWLIHHNGALHFKLHYIWCPSLHTLAVTLKIAHCSGQENIAVGSLLVRVPLDADMSLNWAIWGIFKNVHHKKDMDGFKNNLNPGNFFFLDSLLLDFLDRFHMLALMEKSRVVLSGMDNSPNSVFSIILHLLALVLCSSLLAAGSFLVILARTYCSSLSQSL